MDQYDEAYSPVQEHLQTMHPQLRLPHRDGRERFLVDVSQFVDDHGGGGEDPVSVEEGVEKVYGEEAQICQALQQTLHAGVSDLWHLAGIECLAEANVHVVFMQPGIRSIAEKHHN